MCRVILDCGKLVVFYLLTFGICGCKIIIEILYRWVLLHRCAYKKKRYIMTDFTLPPPLNVLATAIVALLTLPFTVMPATAQTPSPCTITTGNVWSGEGNYSFQGNTLTITEGHYVSFNLIYKCRDLPQDARPVVSIAKPTDGPTGNFEVGGFRGRFSERDGFGDNDDVPRECQGTADATIADVGCRINVGATSTDNNCRNQGATVQKFSVTTRVSNSGPGPLNLSGDQTFHIVAKDDDTVSQKYLDMGYTQWKPTCD